MPPLPRSTLIALASTWVATAPIPAIAAGTERPLTAQLDWTAPPSSHCPSAEAMTQAIEARLMRPVFVSRSKADVWLRVAINPAGKSWHARLEMLDSAENTLGTRDIDSAGPDCGALSEVLPVVIALLLDTSRKHVRLALPAPVSPPPPAPVEAPRLPLAEKHAPPRSADWNVGWAVLAEGIYDLLPGAVPGATLLGRVQPPGFAAPLELWIGALAPVSTADSSGAKFTMTSAGLQTCPALSQKATRWALCAGLVAGMLRSTGRGYDVTIESSKLHLDLRAALQWDVPIARPWFARFELGAVGTLVRHHYVAEAVPGVRTELHRPAVIAPRAALGFGVGFW